MSAARSLLDPTPAGSTGGAANNGPTAPAPTFGGFSHGELGDVRPCSAQLGAEPPRERIASGAAEQGAEIFARLVARAADGSTYDGDLWLDILEYRELRMRSFGPVVVGAQSDARFGVLERKLRADDRGGARQFTRFTCHRTARLSFHAAHAVGSSLDVMIADVSAGGARLAPLRPRPGDECSLLAEGAEVALHVEGAGGPVDTILPSRIVWIRGGAFGLMFAGAPRKAR